MLPFYRFNLFEIIKKIQPDHVAIAWDIRGTSTAKRLEIFPEYKAGRTKPPEDFYAQLPILREVLNYDPDLIVVYCGQNEFLEERTYGQLRDVPPAIRKKELERFKKVVLHEFGHNLGLPHCLDNHCMMTSASEKISTIDNEKMALCAACKKKIGMK